MRRGPGWEAQAAREERRTLRLAAGAVPLTLAERRPLEFLVDKGSHGVAAEELREACGYLVLHPLRVRLRRLIRSGHVVENVGNGFAITHQDWRRCEGVDRVLKIRLGAWWTCATSRRVSTACCRH